MNLDIARLRLRNERLIGTPFKKPEDVVRWMGAVQAQDFPGAKWAIGQRVKSCVDGDVERAYVEGKILRTHVMRPTWHFVMPEDIRWMLELTAPRIKAAMSYYDRKLELDAAVFRRSNMAIGKAVQGGDHLTRTELGQVLANAGIVASGQRLGHVVMRAELDALICSGALRGKQHTYALLDERARNARSRGRDEALAELSTRYFASHGPALARDFGWWSGLTVADASAGIEMIKQDLDQYVVGGNTYWVPPSKRTTNVKDPTIRLLPNYDEYLIAYKDHSASLDAPSRTGSAALNDVLARHIIVLNGRVIGGWRRVVQKGVVTIEGELLAPLSRANTVALHAAAERYSGFLGIPVSVRTRRARL